MLLICGRGNLDVTMVTQKHAKFVSKTCDFLSHVGSVSVSLGVP